MQAWLETRFSRVALGVGTTFLVSVGQASTVVAIDSRVYYPTTGVTSTSPKLFLLNETVLCAGLGIVASSVQDRSSEEPVDARFTLQEVISFLKQTDLRGMPPDLLADRLWQLLIKTYEPLSGLIAKGAFDLAAIQPGTPDRVSNHYIIGYSTGSVLPDIFDIAISPNKETRQLVVNRPRRHEILPGEQMRAGYITHVGRIVQGQEPEQSMHFQRVGVRSKEMIPFGEDVNYVDAIEATKLAAMIDVEAHFNPNWVGPPIGVAVIPRVGKIALREVS